MGYSQNVTVGGSKLSTMSFVKIGDEARKLGDFTPVSLSGKRIGSGNFYLNFYDLKGAQRKVKDDTEIARLWPAAIEDATVKDTAVMIYYKTSAPIGWYLVTDTGSKYSLNDYELKNGDGFLVFASATGHPLGIQLTCSGEVDKSATPIVAVGGSILTGNMTPAAFKLGDLTPVSLSGKRIGSGNFYLNFYDLKGAQRKVKDDTEIARLWPAAIEDATVKDTAVMIYYKTSAPIGWYLVTDTGSKYSLNDYTIQPNDGFLMFASASGHPLGIQIQVPSAIPAESAE